MGPLPFAIVGTGWRARFYLRVAAALPDRFRAVAIVSRDPGNADPAVRRWDVPVVASLDALAGLRPRFVVAAVPWVATPALLDELVERRLPVLCETPPAPDLDGLEALGRFRAGATPIQVAEQYRFQPMHAARLAVAASGRLGTITQAQVSVAHAYHGIDLLRRFLGAGLEVPAISARHFRAPIVAGPDRSGPPTGERIVTSEQVIAFFDFGARLGVLDFADEQYFSWIRSQRVLVRGERGEINDARVRWLLDAQHPVTVDLVRHDRGRDGNLEGLFHAGITLGDAWVYANPFAPASLDDDELAVASCLAGMAEHLEGGPDVCSLTEAAHDHYLGLWMERAAVLGETVRPGGLSWIAPARRSGA